jgi:ATP-dependent Clp protease ATP-binding subunit ClpA
MTSNLRSDEQLREFFRPEFINRLDDVLTFQALDASVIANIVAVQVRRIQETLAEQEIGLELTSAARNEIAREGYDPEFGARPLKRVLQRRVQNLLAESILSNKLQRGDTARIDFDTGNFRMTKRAGEPRKEALKS